MKKNIADLGFLWEGYVTHRSLSEELDSAVVILSTKGELDLAIWDSVALDGEDYITASIETEKLLDPDFPYKHTILLVEPTKYLERITLPNFALTRNEPLLDQLNRLLLNAEPVQNFSDCRFHLAEDLAFKLKSIAGEDFLFSAPTLREAIDSILTVVGCRAKIKTLSNYANIEISFLDLKQPTGKEVTIDKKTAEKVTHSITDHAAEVESNIDSALASGVVAYFPSRDGFARATSAEFTESSKTMIFRLPHPMERLLKFEILMHFSFTLRDKSAGHVLSGSVVAPVDFAHFCIEQELYELLDANKRWEALSDQSLTRSKTLPYTVGNTEFHVGATTKKQIFTRDVLDEIRLFVNDHIKGWGGGVYKAVNTDDDMGNAVFASCIAAKNRFLKEHASELEGKEYAEILIANLLAAGGDMSPDRIYARITYEPQLDLHVKTAKSGDLLPNTLFSNQTAKYADIWRSLDALKAQAEGLGNKDLVIVSHETEVLPLGARYKNYTLTSIESAHFNHYKKHSYAFTENYCYIPERLAVDRRRRLYNIPLDFIDRDILIKDYLHLGEALPATFGRFDVQKLVDYGLPTIIHFTTGIKNGGLFGWYELPLTKISSNKSLLFVTGTTDNYSVATCLKGHPRARFLGFITFERARKVALNPYTNSKGEFDFLHVMLKNERIKDYYSHPSITNIEKNGFPFVGNADGEPYNPPSFSAFNLRQSKDRMERITFTFQLDAFTQDKSVLIGEHFFDILKQDELLIQSSVEAIDNPKKVIYPETASSLVLERGENSQGTYFSFKSPARFVGIYNKQGRLIAGINEGEGKTYYLASLAKTRTRLFSEEELAKLKEEMMHLTKIEMTIAGEHEKTLSLDSTPQLGTTITLVSSSDVLNPNVTPKETLAQKLGTAAKPISAYLKVHDGHYELTFIETETATGNGLAVGLSATKGFTIKLFQGATEVIGAKIKHTKPPV